ncbi:MAG: hypothetical protein LQ337_002497 [Flavoplaca oasis]|nr:MAG: hypothetical protein LQ337_002497 [Flavoplaca oasis]
MPPMPTMQCARKRPQPPISTPPPSSAPNGVKKRGWPKGKPRKGPNARVTRPSTKRKAEQPKFPFMDLPLEIRREVYSLILPQQTPQSCSNGWATMDGIPNEFMNLLLINKQISDEARSVLYGLNTFTIVISQFRMSLPGSFTELEFLPFPTKPSLPFIKNWQIALWPTYKRMTNRRDACFRDAVFSACSEIAKTRGLQTLTLSIPCLCENFHPAGVRILRCNKRCCRSAPEVIEDIHGAMINYLAPFNQLRFKGKVEIITAAKPPKTLWPGEAFPKHFPGSDNEEGYIQLATHPHRQCQQPLCLSFAASFTPIAGLLMGNTTPLSLTEAQLAWLELKKRIHEERDHSECLVVLDNALEELWDALDSGEKEYWRSVEDRVREKIRASLPCSN